MKINNATNSLTNKTKAYIMQHEQVKVKTNKSTFLMQSVKLKLSKSYIIFLSYEVIKFEESDRTFTMNMKQGVKDIREEGKKDGGRKEGRKRKKRLQAKMTSSYPDGIFKVYSSNGIIK